MRQIEIILNKSFADKVRGNKKKYEIILSEVLFISNKIPFFALPNKTKT